MSSTTIHVKNMVYDRCVRVVTENLQTAGCEVKSVELGKVILASDLNVVTEGFG